MPFGKATSIMRLAGKLASPRAMSINEYLVGNGLEKKNSTPSQHNQPTQAFEEKIVAFIKKIMHISRYKGKRLMPRGKVSENDRGTSMQQQSVHLIQSAACQTQIGGCPELIYWGGGQRPGCHRRFRSSSHSSSAWPTCPAASSKAWCRAATTGPRQTPGGRGVRTAPTERGWELACCGH